MRRYTFSLLVLGFASSFSFAAEPRGAKPSNPIVAKQLQTALELEATGQSVNRRDLTYGLTLQNPAEHWQVGELLQGDKWLTADSLNSESAAKDLKEYRDLRKELKDNPDSHRILAKWCHQHKLPDEAKAHWQAILLSNSSDQEARRALGHQWIGDQWFSVDELKEADQRTAQLQHEWRKWMPQMRAIVTQIQSTNSKQKQTGLKALDSINDPAAISSLEIVALQLDQDHAVPFVEAIAKHRSQDACLALARIAVASPSSAQGEVAIENIKRYPKEFYVPELLSLLSTPIEAKTAYSFNQKGELLIRCALFRETKNEKQELALRRLVRATENQDSAPEVINSFGQNRTRDTRVIGSSVMGVSTVASINDDELSAAKSAGEDQHSLRNRLAEHNFDNADLSNRVYSVLEKTTGQVLERTPNSWWKRWQEYNEFESGRKRLNARSYDTIDQVRSVIYAPIYLAEGLNVAPPHAECLVAGSTIQTANGLVPIETIQVGDRVLSQNVNTGELTLKPVIGTTLRAPRPIHRIVTSSGEYRATGGHRWFVSGRGWLMTRELETGMVLHTATGTSKVVEVVQEKEELPTHNLIVEGFHTYFVGKDRILSYDVTELAPTLLPVPGYAALAKSGESK